MDASTTLMILCLQNGWPEMVPEYRFHATRKWRFDFAFPDQKVAVEIEGVTYSGKGGRHQRAQGYEKDCVKYNEANLDGWCLLRFTPRQITHEMDMVEAAITRALGRNNGY